MTSQPKISRHLAQLREAGIVSDRRQGIWIYYRLHPALPDWTLEVLAATSAGVQAETPFSTDLDTLEKMPARPGQTTQCA
jgi:ArsR family transcriptional regulator